MLETRNLFIDTQYFVKNNFDFSSTAFITLKSLCENEELKYFITSVVQQEVESRIALSIKNALNSLQSFKKKAQILSTIDNALLAPLFSEFNEDELAEKVTDAFNKYNTDCKCEYIKATAINPEMLLDLYFSKKPPFGEGKKKAEFPDAISLLSLESHLGINEKAYVISEDNDLKTYCDANHRLIFIDSLEKLLDIYNQHSNARTNKIKQYITNNKEEIKTIISEYINSCDIYNNSTWEDSEVDSFIIDNIDDFDVNVIEVNNESCQLTFDAQINITVEVTGPNFENGFYDKEDGHIYTFSSITRIETIPLELMCELELNYEFEDGELLNTDFGMLKIQNMKNGIEISVNEYPEPDWY
ncbi:PIN domain-containing protein [Plesiomonas shigelloides]|uniref:PIN domain-containing protein n=1 Tax=Plesiomonas shigelloides TaxID=703 RepID=UPI00387F0F10